MRAVALVAAASLFGCFSTSHRTRTIAKITEGGLIVAGIVMEAFTKTDCSLPSMPGVADGGCHTRNAAIGNVGVAMILGGLLGFVVTVSTTPDEKTAPRIDIKASDAKKSDDAKPKLSAPIAKPPAAAAVEAKPATTDEHADAAPAPADAAPATH
jgi:hypothetical protein